MIGIDTDELKRAYDLLGVPYSASVRSINDSYRRMAKRWHPDRYKTGTGAHAEATEMMQRINAAFSQIADAPLRDCAADGPFVSDRTRRINAVVYAMSAVRKKAPPWYTKFFGLRGLLRLFAISLGVYSTAFFLVALGQSTPREPRSIGDAFRLVIDNGLPVLLFSAISSFLVWARGLCGATRGNDTPEELKDYDWWGRPIHHEFGKRRYTAYSLERFCLLLLALATILAVLLPALTK